MDAPDGHDFVLVGDSDVNDYNEAGLLPQSPEILKDIQKWLEPTDYAGEASEYNKHLNSYVPGTGIWIQETEAYQKWHTSPGHGSLWTKAIAGAGKSVFAAMIAAKLSRLERVPVLSFFFRQIVATNHTPHAMTRDFISMLLNHSPALQKRMKTYIDERRSLQNVSADEFWQDLVQALVELPKVYIVVDALDEMDIENEDFLGNLVALGKRRPGSIKLLMTSRPLPYIEAFLKEPSVLQIRLEQSKVDKDIAVYVDHQLNKQQEVNLELRVAIQAAINAKAQGSFLYARLMMDELLDHIQQMVPDIKFIQRSLDWLPITLEDMYNGMLLDHSLRSRVSQELQVTILQWVTHSSRPLRLLEIATMLDSQNSLRCNKDTKSIVRTACGPLLEILEDETVSVIHHSFTEFLTDPERETRHQPNNAQHPQFPVIDPVKTHKSLAMTCISYLNSERLSSCEFDAPRIKDNRRRRLSTPAQDLKLQHPFLDYAMRNWYVHAGKPAGVDASLIQSLGGFIQIENAAFLAWLELSFEKKKMLRNTSPLHIAAWAGLVTYTEHLLKSGEENNGRDGLDRTPLSWASERGHKDVAALLLKCISDPDLDDYNGLKPLHYAAQANHHDIVRLLLAAGVSPLTGKTRDPGRRCGNSPSSIGHSPLMYACNAGATDSVREMIPFLAPNDLHKALCWASKAGKCQIVDLLLAHPQTPIDPPEASDTVLFLAASGLHFDIMHSLLMKGIDPNRRSRNIERMRGFTAYELMQTPLGFTAFHAICGVGAETYSRRKDEEAVEKAFHLLYNAGCDINARDSYGKTPLHHSVSRGRYSGSSPTRCKLSTLLLENGADIMARDKDGNTPLHLANLGESGADMARLCLENGADVAAKRPTDGKTPLHTMMAHVYTPGLSSILPYVENWNVQDNDGNTPLHLLLSSSYHPQSTLKLLLDAGADLHIRNKKWETPLHGLKEICSSMIGQSVLPDLLTAGADLEAKDKNGQTLAFRVMTSHVYNFQQTLDCLIENGAKFDVCDNIGDSILHVICRASRNLDLIKLLVNAGANPLLLNHDGNTLLHEVVIGYSSQEGDKLFRLLEYLLSLGLSPTAKNNAGRSPIHHAIASMHPQSYGTGDRIDALTCVVTSALGSDLNLEDYDGIRPIHLAATFSEDLVTRLIEAGADTTAVTYENKSLLHIAASMRQSNMVGMLLEHFSSLESISLIELVNSQDSAGRTPLHYACRSGRLETVQLLLNAGADPTILDKKSLSPLHACAEFQEEDFLWSTPATKIVPSGILKACGILSSDPRRPKQGTGCSYSDSDSHFARIHKESDTVRTREIIQLLVAKGANLAAVEFGQSPINFAISKGCAEMVDELLPKMEQVYKEVGTDKSRWMTRHDPFRAKCLASFSGIDILDLDLKSQDNIACLCKDLLALRNHKTIAALPSLGVDFYPNPKRSDDILTELVRWGYASLFAELGDSIEKHEWINGIANEDHDYHKTTLPFLITAAQRELPNLDVIRLIVERFGADVNVQPESSVYLRDGGYKYVPGQSALHILAAGKHWWNAEALQYLLEHGGNTELVDEKGLTPLHAAVSNSSPDGRGKRRQVARILLAHGANPNVLDEMGSSCLNKAMYDIKMVRLLIEHGADISLGEDPILFSAISTQDIEAVTTILKAGANCNIKKITCIDPQIVRSNRRPQEPNDFPLRFAASSKFNTVRLRDIALQITRLLLKHGANPFMPYDGTTIVHDTFKRGGLLQPFLDLPNLDLEYKDEKGQTLLLAACQSSHGSHIPLIDTHEFGFKSYQERQKENQDLSKDDPSPARTFFERGSNLMAIDNLGNNALHLLVSTTPHNNEQYQKTLTLFLEKAPNLLNQKTLSGNSPLHLAVSPFRIWTVETFIAAGANVLDKDESGNTPLHCIARSLSALKQDEWLSWFKRFLDLGIDINEKNNDGETMLFNFFRVPMGQRALYAAVENTGADLFTRNNTGETILHIVAKHLDDNRYMSFARSDRNFTVENFKWLMGLGLDPMAEDNNQRTPLDVAAACGNDPILALFKRDKGPVPPPSYNKPPLPYEL